MQKEIRKRKKRFWVVCLAAVLLLQGAMPSLTAMAVDYNADDESKFYHEYDINSPGFNSANTIALNPKDTITFEARIYAGPSICLYDSNDAILATIMSDDMGISITEQSKPYTYTLPSYDDATKSVAAAIPAGQFKEWQVTHIERSGGLHILKIKAVPYVEHSITYQVDTTKGMNASGNPSKFREGEGATIAPATANPGYRFEGWYTTDESTAATSYIIPTTATGNVTLTAKFVPEQYSIAYDLGGGSNAATNPSGYVYGTGVAGFANPTRDGYTFGGWYNSAAYTTQITSISATNIGDVGLWAKWTANDYTIHYNLNGGRNAATNPTGYTYGMGVADFANPTRDGYTFEGWYNSAAYITPITSISATQTGDVSLWAKWAEIVEEDDDEDDEPEPVATPQPAVKDAVPKTGDAAGAAVPVCLAGGAITALGLLALGKRRSRRA